MIVAVEGPSAAGKTTWCRQQGLPTVEEYVPTGHEPDGSDSAAQADYWTKVNSARWTEARGLETDHPVVVCDSDPVKLHYSWCLARVGAAPWRRFNDELAAVRRAFSAGDLGFADLTLVSILSLATLRKHRDADPTRRRRSFSLHATLSDPLRQWYQALELVEPGRVIWELPEGGIPAQVPRPRAQRSSLALLEAFVALLPAS